MAGVDIGGDESVMWSATGDNVRKDKSLKHENHGEFGWLQTAVDEAQGDFTIIIELPQDAAGLFKRMRDGLDAAEITRTPITFTVPIEFGHHNQIQVRWNSDLSNPHHIRKTTAARLASVKTASKKATKQQTKASGKTKKKASSKKRKSSNKR